MRHSICVYCFAVKHICICRQQIMAALNAQTHAQFQQYAAQQHPGDAEQVRN